MPWAPDYVTDSELEDFVRAVTGDAYIPGYGTAASRAVDDYCNRQFGRFDDDVEMIYDGCDASQLPNGRWLLPVDDVPAAAGITLTVDGTATTAGVDGYQLFPRNNLVVGRPCTGLTFATKPCGDVSLTTRFGWLAVPAAVPAAVRLQVNRWHIRRESPYGTAGAPQEGSEIRLSARLDPDVRTVLSGGGVVRARLPR